MRPVGSAIELEKRRKDAVRRIRDGERVTDVANDLGVSRVAVSKWKKAAIEVASEHSTRCPNMFLSHECPVNRNAS